MSDTDRIAQMAREAGGMLDPDFYDTTGGDRTMWLLQPHELAAFARLVAEDCATICDGMPYRAAGAGKAAQEIRARYSKGV